MYATSHSTFPDSSGFRTALPQAGSIINDKGRKSSTAGPSSEGTGADKHPLRAVQKPAVATETGTAASQYC